MTEPPLKPSESSSQTELRERLVHGLERTGQLFDSLRSEQQSWQAYRQEQRRRSRKLVRLAGVGLALLAVLVAVNAWAVLREPAPSKPDSGPDSSRLAEVERRLQQLESHQRAIASKEMLGDPPPAVRRPGARSPQRDGEDPVSYTFKPEAPLPSRIPNSEQLSEVLAKSRGTTTPRLVAEEQSVGEKWTAPADAVPSSSAPVEPAATPPRDPEPEPGGGEAANPGLDSAPSAEAIRNGLNRLLGLGGATRYRCMGGHLEEEPRALRDPVFVQLDARGGTIATVLAETAQLVYDHKQRQGRLVLHGARGQQKGMDLVYPHQELVITIPGPIPEKWLDRELQKILRDPDSVTDAQKTLGAMASIADQLNHVLALERRSIRVRQVERVEGKRLHDVVVDLEFDPSGAATKTLRAKELWWELNPEHGFVEMQCEGGTLEVNGESRPLFRGRFRHSLHNVQSNVWKSLDFVDVHGVPSSP